ncbi:MAG: gamma-glutamyltransferase [Planctomycetes bacterium]|nr:gamma-glutamyltransferase [Planctomycetota bacterium]
MLHLFLTVLLLALVLSTVSVAQSGGDRPFGRPWAGRSPVLAQRGMACTSQPLATQVALDVLKRGGSAVDAAIAANACLALMEPTGCGLGGDLFAIVWDPKTRKVVGLNASGRSPKGMTLDALKERLGDRTTIPLWGPLPVSVPGCVSGWKALHDRFGRLERKDVLGPAIGYAKEGFPVSEIIAGYWAMNLTRFAAESKDITEFDNFRKTFVREGRAPRAGEVFANADLAKTLQRLADDGFGSFYTGKIADVIDAYCKRVDCPLRKNDLAAHAATWVEPASTTYRGVVVFELPPNGQGVAALQMLNVLEGYDLAAQGHNSAEYLHHHIEAKKLAFADRARFYADPAFSDVPLRGLISKPYAKDRRKLIDPARARRRVDAGNPRLHQGDTIYLTVADRDGMMVSLIQSNYVGMGSGLVPDGLGFALQDRGGLFTLEKDHANVYAPGKRPFHTIIPAFATKDDAPWLSFGVMGGAMQPQGHVQIICNLVDFGMNVQEAGDAARYNHTGSSQPTGTLMEDGGVVHLEGGIPLAVRRALEKRGHRLALRGSFGGYQAILRDPVTGVYHGASEMRKDGQAAGY